MADDIL